MTAMGFAKVMVVSLFAGSAVGIGAALYGLLFPHPTSMFFSTAYRVSNYGLAWSVTSVFLFACAMLIALWPSQHKHN